MPGKKKDTRQMQIKCPESLDNSAFIFYLQPLFTNKKAI